MNTTLVAINWSCPYESMIRMIVDIIYRLLRGCFPVLLDIPEAERGVWPRQPSLINHYEKAIGIASTFKWLHSLFGINYYLAGLFLSEKRFEDAHAHLERAKSHAINAPYNLGCAMELQARIWYEEGRLEEAKSQALLAASVFEKMGAVKEVEICRSILRDIEQKMKDPVTSGKFLEMVLLPTPVNSPFLAQGTE